MPDRPHPITASGLGSRPLPTGVSRRDPEKWLATPSSRMMPSLSSSPGEVFFALESSYVAQIMNF